MKVLIDTNIMLDNLMQRKPDTEYAEKIFGFCATGRLDGYVAAHSILDAFYIMRKHFSDVERRKALKKVCEIVSIVSVDERKIKAALECDDFRDFEDCVQAKCAWSCNADYIITRNVKDFSKSSIPAITAEEFVNEFVEQFKLLGERI